MYPGDPPFDVVQTRSFELGDDMTLSRLEIGSHTGTHVDAPSHFVMGGATLDQLPLDTFVGPARVLDSTHVQSAISAGEVARHKLRHGEIVLFKTRNSTRWAVERAFFQDFVHLDLSAAEAIVGAGVKCVGIDYLSVEGFGAVGAPVHRKLLMGAVGIIEGLDLSRVRAGAYDLFCLPLRVQGAEGAPARAVLLEGA